jgi:hypothetical protein
MHHLSLIGVGLTSFSQSAALAIVGYLIMLLCG